MSSELHVIQTVLNSDEFAHNLLYWSKEISAFIVESADNNKLITLFGNGGSAADSQHWAAELICTYKGRSRRAYPAIALSTDSSVLTAWSNDFDFSGIYSRQIQGLGALNGVAIGISTSGKSENVLNGLAEALNNGARTVFITGDSVKLRHDLDLHVILPSKETSVLQTLTQILYHGVCDLLEHL